MSDDSLSSGQTSAGATGEAGLCKCGDRAKSACPGEWEQGCDLGENEKFVRVHQQTPEERAALDAALRDEIVATGNDYLKPGTFDHYWWTIEHVDREHWYEGYVENVARAAWKQALKAQAERKASPQTSETDKP